MQKVLAKKYPVQRAILRMKNLYEPGQFTVTAAMVVYLVKETMGPSLRRLLAKTEEEDRKLLLYMAQKMAKR
jgi:hypothetical protein